MSEPLEHKDILDLYWPVIEAARKVRTRYCGALKRICPDETGAMIEALNKAERVCYVVQRDDT